MDIKARDIPNDLDEAIDYFHRRFEGELAQIEADRAAMNMFTEIGEQLGLAWRASQVRAFGEFIAKLSQIREERDLEVKLWRMTRQ